MFAAQSFYGIPIFVTEYALRDTEERLFPESRHRSKRVRKKLIKRFGGEFRLEPAIFGCGGRIVMHPVRYAELKRGLREDQQ